MRKNASLVGNRGCLICELRSDGGDEGKGAMGRRLMYPEKREAAFPAGTLDRIQAVLREGEDRAEFIREAVFRELAWREGRTPPKP